MINPNQLKIYLGIGVDDYPFQLRSRILVGTRWLNYTDSLYEGKTVQK
jgi:hypothetical protein